MKNKNKCVKVELVISHEKFIIIDSKHREKGRNCFKNKKKLKKRMMSYLENSESYARIDIFEVF